jgi:hypothetical protein
VRLLRAALLTVALVTFSACSTSSAHRKPPISIARSLTSATIFTKTPIRLTLERLTHLAHAASSEAESFAISPTKKGEIPFLVVLGDTEVRILCGYEGDFSSYLTLALRPAMKASARNQELQAQLGQLAGSYKDVMWLQIVPSDDAQGKVRALIRSLAEEVGGTIYSQGTLFEPHGGILWSTRGTHSPF